MEIGFASDRMERRGRERRYGGFHARGNTSGSKFLQLLPDSPNHLYFVLTFSEFSCILSLEAFEL